MAVPSPGLGHGDDFVVPYMIGLLWAGGAEPALQRQDEVVGSRIELVPSG